MLESKKPAPITHLAAENAAEQFIEPISLLRRYLIDAAGWFHTCVLLGSGALQCWGANNSGQLGSVTASALSEIPVDVFP